MTRKEAYSQIKSLCLEEVVKNQYGKNYTVVATEDLEKVIQDALNNKSSNQEEAPTKPIKSTEPTSNEVINPYEAAWVAALGILKDSGVLDETMRKL